MRMLPKRLLVQNAGSVAYLLYSKKYFHLFLLTYCADNNNVLTFTGLLNERTKNFHSCKKQPYTSAKTDLSLSTWQKARFTTVCKMNQNRPLLRGYALRTRVGSVKNCLSGIRLNKPS